MTEDVSELSSSSSSFPSRQSGGRSKKRKRSQGQEIGLRASRQKKNYSAKYHNLFNNTTRALQPGTRGPADKDGLTNTQLGMSTWSPEEKDQLFRGMARYGQDDLPAIAVLVGTKTELEVHAHLHVLQEASKKQHKYGERRSLISAADIATAVEISDQCCASLEQAADAMAALQQRVEEQSEKRRHDDLWRLDHKIAKWIDRRLSEGDEGRVEVCRRLPAAEILNLSQLLKLSANVFMNSNEPHSNYRSFVSRSEKPSILHTAFADLHTLALSVVKRLIQSSLFFAKSRLRATRSLHYAHQRVVKQADVLAALKVLGLKENARDYWLQVPRRCGLNVYDQVDRRDAGVALDYREVERALQDVKSVTGKKSDIVDPGGEQNNFLQPLNEVSSNSESKSGGSSSVDIDHPEDPSAQSSEQTVLLARGERFGEQTDRYLEHIDQTASDKEELRLWKMLKKNPPPNVPLQESSVKLRNPGPCRKDKDDMDNWRDWVKFGPERDMYDVDSLNEDVAENREQMRLRMRKLACSVVQRRYVQSAHQEENLQTSASDQTSSSIGATPINESSTDAISLTNEENPDDMNDQPLGQHSQEFEEDFENVVEGHHGLLQTSGVGVQTSVDNEFHPPGKQRHESKHRGTSAFKDEVESEDGRDDQMEESADISVKEYWDSSVDNESA
ncbi:MAG: hypothetical protein Q9216_002162 [Gyalolechia sp. 2 TL-2023]